MLIATHQCHNEDATAEARKHKRDFSPTAFLRIIPPDTVMSGNRLPDIPSTSPTPETLPRTALAPSPSIIPPRPSQPSAGSAQPPHSSQSASTRPQHPPPTGPCSDPKRPRIPSKGSAPSGSHSGYMSQFPDNTRPVGSSASSADRSGRGPYHKGKGADKGTFKGKDKFPSDWPPLNPGSPWRLFEKILLRSPPKVLPRVLIKASLMVKVLLHLPFSHLPPTPHLVAVHKISLPTSFNSHHFPRCQPGHIVRLAVGILFLPPPLIWSSLSHLYIPSQFVTVFPFSSLFSRCSFFTPDSSSPCYAFSSPLYTNTTPLKLSPYLSFVASLGILSGSPLFTSLRPRFLRSPLSPPSFFSVYFLPLLPPFSSASPLLRPFCLSRCLPKVARPNVAAPFVAIAQSGRLPPCRAPLAWCRLWSSAIIGRCSYVPPTILVPPMLMDAVDHLLLHCLLAFSSHWRSSLLYNCILFANICSSLFGCPHETPLSFTEEVGNGVTSLWHIVRPVLLRSSILSPFIYFNIPPQRPLSSTFFQTSPLGNFSHFKPYLVQWQLHTLIYIFTGSFKKSQTSLHNISPYLPPYSTHWHPPHFS